MSKDLIHPLVLKNLFLGEILNEDIESALHGDFEVLLFNATIDDNKEGYRTSKKEKKAYTV